MVIKRAQQAAHGKIRRFAWHRLRDKSAFLSASEPWASSEVDENAWTYALAVRTLPDPATCMGRRRFRDIKVYSGVV